jgi:hypothetical protein
VTTPARADLTGLFTAPAASEPYRQGVILTFNPATGANTVQVGGAVLTDLPILAGGDTVNFAADDVVVLLRYRSSWAILGRIVVPGNTDLLATAVGFAAGSNSVTGFTVTAVYATQGEVSIVTPAWANSLLLMGTVNVTLANGSGSTDTARVHTQINSTTAGETLHQVPNGNFQGVSSSLAVVLGAGGSAPLTATTLVQGRVRSNGGTWVAGGIQSVVNAIGIFRRA